MLVNGVWTEDWQPVQAKDKDGRFVRQASSFRNWITADGSAGPTGIAGFKAEKGRYHLYVAYICPWASRTLMARALKGLTDYIDVTVVNPRLSDQGWQFGGFDGLNADPLNDAAFVHQLYTKADPQFTGRATVPVLWDKHTQTIVNNESADIVRMFDTGFSELVNQGPVLFPENLANDIDLLNEQMYNSLNNGVYKAGFATTQVAYEEAYHAVFNTLDMLEQRLSDGRAFLFGDLFTESDIRLFVTLIRFDAAYYSLFKCNRNQLKEMPYLHAYTQRVLALDGIKDTVNIEHIKAGYYSIKALNPNGIVPVGPDSI
ncbi:glutathione S-transferase C-terminal domain-containing protein [Shewanella avicenniae]|uniref:Glutathione S-transferase C-terminal domain-containing protein n=1 Tax=Shewanella avicenniae TaxID=2814294 RepID=A0ABX7QWA7_9GAMM|nr:glutathione S-transferase C-terminal domain-containing protein [Shewanella avicenniae]QSX35190.1 glutathione S-transferase C-terminal domain-containing protein [Shewanella avicenniae]